MDFDTDEIRYETPFSALLNQKDDALEDAKASVEKELKQRYSVPEPELDKSMSYPSLKNLSFLLRRRYLCFRINKLHC